MRARRGVRSTAAALAVTLVSAACAAAPPRDDVRTLSVVMADDWATAPVVNAVIADFEREHEGLRVQLQPAPFSQIADLVRTGSELGDPYDVAHWHAFAAGAAGLAQPLDDLWDEAGMDPADYLDGAVQDVTWDDDVRYGVPLDVNAMVLMANTDALDAAEVAVDDLADAAQLPDVARRLAEVEGIEHALTVSASSWAAYGWIRAFGGDVLRRDGDGAVAFTFDDPRTVSALRTLQQLVDEGTAPAPFAPDLALDAVQAFTQGTTALHASGSWDLAAATRSVNSGLDAERLQVLPLPQVDADGGADVGTVLGGSSLFVPVGSEKRELAFAFMQALTAEDVGAELAMTEGRLPAGRAAYDDPRFAEDPRFAAFITQLDDADVMPLIAYPAVEAAFSDALEAILKGADAEATLLAVQARAEAAVEP